MAPLLPRSIQIPQSDASPTALVAHDEVRMGDQVHALQLDGWQFQSVRGWSQMLTCASHAWPIVCIHSSLLQRQAHQSQALSLLRQFGSRIVLLAEPELKDPHRAARILGADDWLYWSADSPNALLQCMHHATEQITLHEQICAQDGLYQRISRGSHDGLWDWNLTNNHLSVSNRFLALIGQAKRENFRIRDWFGLLHPDEEMPFRAALRAHVRGEHDEFSRNHRIRLPNGQWRWYSVQAVTKRDDMGRPVRMAGSITDIQHAQDTYEKTAYEALHDPVTALSNKTAFVDHLERCLTRAVRSPEQRFSVLHIDVDRFKVVNEALGHTLGDILLKDIADRLKAAIPHNCMLARIEADEFALLIEDSPSEEDIACLAESLRRSMRNPFTLGGLEIYATISVGIAHGPGNYRCPSTLLRDAERAQIAAKSEGPNGQQVYEGQFKNQAAQLASLEADLRKALENEDFELHYQPIIPLSGKGPDAFEALIRWNHPERGWVSPGVFIPFAEVTGLIIPLGRWVLEQAFTQAWIWHCEDPETAPAININLSAVQFHQPDLVETIARLFTRYPLPAGKIRLEITETALMDDIETQIRALTALRALGAEIQIDDFGTGFSSLSQLARLPVDALKIDRTFIAEMENNARSAAIVQTIAQLAHSLGLTVTAEGIETPTQLATIEALHCTSAQGFLFSRAVPSEDARRWATKQAAYN